jgi:hypothetical protein
MDGPVSFFDDGYHYLQEQFSSRMSQAYSDSRIDRGKGNGAGNASSNGGNSTKLRCNQWNDGACNFGTKCKFVHECNQKQCRGNRSDHRATSCTSKSDAAAPAGKKTKRDNAGKE